MISPQNTISGSEVPNMLGTTSSTRTVEPRASKNVPVLSSMLNSARSAATRPPPDVNTTLPVATSRDSSPYTSTWSA